MQVALIGIGRRNRRLKNLPKALVKLPDRLHRLQAWDRRLGGSHNPNHCR